MSEKSTILSEVEGIKERSDYLRGTLVESLADPLTGALAEDDTQLSKFHGLYQQDDRDLRAERRRQKLEPAYSFMIRVRIPAGIVTPSQWLELDALAGRYANGTLRLTTRQAIQYHGVIKSNLKPTIAAINAALMDTVAACGDVNRNVMATAYSDLSAIHQETAGLARAISDHLTPRTRAYHEIWLDGEKLVSTEEDHEPVYGKTYLPRKFKTAVVIPPLNDVDVFAHDLGFIAIEEDGVLQGYNVSVGGGMGTSHGEPATYPRLADVIGFCPPELAVAVAEAVVTTQRDFGDRTNRKHARLKYTIDDRGVDWFRTEVESRLGQPLEAPRPVRFVQTGDRYGWLEGDDGSWHLTLFIENGRLLDNDNGAALTGMREIAGLHRGEFRITPNQNLVISNVAAEDKTEIDRLARKHGLLESASPLRRASMACVGLPTCGLAMAESERYLPEFVSRLEALQERHGLGDQPIVVRMTGCPNGCARPFVAEIGLVGKGPGSYNLYLGASYSGQRLNKLYLENVGEDRILEALEPLFARYAAERQAGEHFGDFLVRAGVVPAVTVGREFHDEPPARASD